MVDGARLGKRGGERQFSREIPHSTRVFAVINPFSIEYFSGVSKTQRKGGKGSINLSSIYNKKTFDPTPLI